MSTIRVLEKGAEVPVELSGVVGLVEIYPDLFHGIYFLCYKGEVVYVGQSQRTLTRVIQHKGNKKFDRVLFLQVPVDQLKSVELKFIKELKPKLNVRGVMNSRQWNARLEYRYGGLAALCAAADRMMSEYQSNKKQAA
jgi:hypothetical protein